METRCISLSGSLSPLLKRMVGGYFRSTTETMASSLAPAINHFAVDMLNLLSKGHKNVVFSPVSISAALTIALLGSHDETAAQIYRGLRLDETSMSPRRVKDEFKVILKYLILNIDLNILMGNYLMLQEDTSPIVGNFVREMELKLDGHVEAVDFRLYDEVKNFCNVLMSAKTHGHIQDLLSEPVPAYISGIILSGAFFASKWQKEFTEGRTRNQPFFNDGKDPVMVPFMERMEERYSLSTDVIIADQKCTLLAIPFKGEVDMMVLLPEDKDGIEKMEKIDYQQLDLAIKGMAFPMIDLFFPRFRVDISQDIIPQLSAMGIHDLFEEGVADLSEINEGNNHHIGLVMHTTFLQVNEKGTDPLASKPIVSSCPPRDPLHKRIVVDHPFLFFLRSKTLGIFLMAGSVNRL